MKIFIISGKGGSGKDTFVELYSKYIEKKYNDVCYNISSVDEIKEIARKYFGWKGQKTSEWRKTLSDLKDLQTRSCDGPFNYMKICFSNIIKEEFHHNRECVVFLHIRETEEIERAKKEFNAKTILIKRFDETVSYGNHADDNVENYNYDYVFENYGTLEELNEKVIELVKIKEKESLTK
ncbi:hypothetical protein GW796_05460 [archaeon]|nr:hypothetical protein [archaeon]NCQ51331.1 hypothetical protein [archaeon]NCT58843.1 hypothetical protein [archaeon]